MHPSISPNAQLQYEMKGLIASDRIGMGPTLKADDNTNLDFVALEVFADYKYTYDSRRGQV